MKIVHIITALGIGGAEKLLINVVNKQTVNNEVHVIYLKKIEDLIPTINPSIKVKHIPLSLLTVNKLKKYFKEVKPDVIHTHLSHADIIGMMASMGTKTKVFCTMHNIYFKQNFIDNILFFLYSILFKMNKINVISISKSVEKHVTKTLKQNPKRSYLLYNAIPAYKLKEVINKNDKKTIDLLFVGRLVKQKSIDTLLKAVSLLKEEKIKLTIVGDGDLKVFLENLTSELNIIDKVSFVGKKENVDHFFHQSDIFILPSIWEGFGIVILEAFRSKCAVISTNIEGPSELIEHKKNGLLFTPENDNELVTQIKYLIQNPEKRKNYAEEGYNAYTEKFHIETYVKKLQKIYVEADI